MVGVLEWPEESEMDRLSNRDMDGLPLTVQLGDSVALDVSDNDPSDVCVSETLVETITVSDDESLLENSKVSE